MKTPLKVGLCSYGMSGRVFHAPFVERHSGFSLYAVLERSKRNAAAEYPSIISYTTLDELLADPAIDLVIVNTPNATHFEFSKKALLAGKHVVVEKPFTVTVEEGIELIALAKKLNRILSVFQNRRYDSDFKTVASIYHSGVLGELYEAEFHFDRYNPSLSAKQHKEKPEPGAGVLFDLGPHLIDQAVFLFGRPSAVFADLQIQREESEIADYFDLLLFYPRLRVRLKSGYFVREPISSFVLHGSKGSFLKSRSDIQEKLLLQGVKPVSSNWGIEPEEEAGLLHTETGGELIRKKIPSHCGDYGEYYQGLFEALMGRAPVPVRGEDGLAVMEIIYAALASDKAKAVVSLKY